VVYTAISIRYLIRIVMPDSIRFERKRLIRRSLVHGAVIMALPLQEFTRFIWRMYNGANWQSTHWPSRSARATNPPKLQL